MYNSTNIKSSSSRIFLDLCSVVSVIASYSSFNVHLFSWISSNKSSSKNKSSRWAPSLAMPASPSCKSCLEGWTKDQLLYSVMDRQVFNRIVGPFGFFNCLSWCPSSQWKVSSVIPMLVHWQWRKRSTFHLLKSLCFPYLSRSLFKFVGISQISFLSVFNFSPESDRMSQRGIQLCIFYPSNKL